MSNTSNFREAMRQAKSQALVGSNAIANALPPLGRWTAQDKYIFGKLSIK